jgi:hypothetical protein
MTIDAQQLLARVDVDELVRVAPISAIATVPPVA